MGALSGFKNFSTVATRSLKRPQTQLQAIQLCFCSGNQKVLSVKVYEDAALVVRISRFV